MDFRILLLAAGEGRRFGGDKLRQPLAGGTPMVRASAQALCDGYARWQRPHGAEPAAPAPGRPAGRGVPSGASAAAVPGRPPVLVVARPGDRGLAGLLADLPLVAVHRCAQSAQGIGASLACGVRASRDADAWLVALADMPLVTPATVARLLAALASGASLVAPCWCGQRGHPVGFHRRWAGRLAALSGDAGARRLLSAHPQALTLIDTDDAGVCADVDRPDDLIVR